ncbi:MAG: hypothetical protein KBD64_00780 [Gammaproteobacteria bacterium]|nr:hypothetical protein [Gammaproteobacteria bacterium]
MLGALITPLKNTTKTFYQGLLQVKPNKNILEVFENCKLTATIYNQILHYNLKFYLLPIVIFYWIIKPIFSLLNFNKISILDLSLDLIFKIYLLKRIAEMLIYNLILTFAASTTAAAESPDIKQAKICDCSKMEKAKQLAKGPLYYLSNHCLAKIISLTFNPLISFPFKTITYGQALVEDYLTNAGSCVLHRQNWLSKHNKFALGIGASFILSHSLLSNLSIYFINFLSAYKIDSISSFIIQDSFFNIIWLFFILNIHINSTLLLTTSEQPLYIFKFNHLIIDKIYDYWQPKISRFISYLGKNPPNLLLTSMIQTLTKIFKIILPKSIINPEILLSSPPLQLFLAQNSYDLLKITTWLQKLDQTRYFIISTDWLRLKSALKSFFSRWIPKALITLLFFAITKHFFAKINLQWLEKNIRDSKIDSLKDNNSTIGFFIKIIKKMFNINSDVRCKITDSVIVARLIEHPMIEHGFELLPMKVARIAEIAQTPQAAPEEWEILDIDLGTSTRRIPRVVA